MTHNHHRLIRVAFLLLAFACSASAPALPPKKQSMSTAKPTFYYVFDALCGWCYGFSPTMQRIAAQYQDKLQFEVISGGMVTGQRIGPIGQVAGYIRTAYKDVERTTGTKFGPGFLQGTLAKGTATFSSIEPAKALATFRNHKPQQALAFAHTLQHAIYFDGVAPTDLDAFADLAAKQGIDKAGFLREARSREVEQQMLKEFRTSDSLGVQGFPTLFLMRNGKLVKLAEGYVAEKELMARIERVLTAK